MVQVLLLAVAGWVVSSARAFDLVNAQAFAALTEAAYCGPDPRVLQWQCDQCQQAGFQVVPGSARFVQHGELGERNSTFVYIARITALSSQWISGCTVAFRGSHTVTNWIRDLSAWQVPVPFEWCEGCHAEAGFYTVLKNVLPELVAALADIGCPAQATTEDTSNALYITGHSLGAAVSHLAMALLDMQGYDVRLSHTFESPRVGDAKFASVFDSEWKKRQVPVYRITHHMDPVPHLPLESMGYQHVNTEVFFDSDTTTYKICTATEDPSCSNIYPLEVAFLNPGDHCKSPLATKGDICSCILDETDTSGSVLV